MRTSLLMMTFAVALSGCLGGPPTEKQIRDNAYCTQRYAPGSSEHEYCNYERSIN